MCVHSKGERFICNSYRIYIHFVDAFITQVYFSYFNLLCHFVVSCKRHDNKEKKNSEDASMP